MIFARKNARILHDNHSSRIRFFTFFFENPKNATFYVFLKRHLNKNVKNVIHNSKFQTLLTFHYMESPLQLKTMYVYNKYGLSSCVKDNKFGRVSLSVAFKPKNLGLQYILLL